MTRPQGQSLPPWLIASDSNPQEQSSLFRFPPEVRIIVFAYALVECDDLSRPYSKHKAYYRTEFKFAGKITTSLLLTCRQVYIEARLLPVAVNDHIFWQGNAPRGRLVGNHAAYFGRMSSEQIALVRHARFFADFCWLERLNSSVSWSAGLALRKITITIRHMAWNFWYDDYDDFVGRIRARNPAKCWGGWIGNMPTLEELEVELESERCEQLEAQALKACRWIFPRACGDCLVHNGVEPTKSMRLLSSFLDPALEYDEPYTSEYWPGYDMAETNWAEYDTVEQVWDGYGHFNQQNWRGSSDTERSDDDADIDEPESVGDEDDDDTQSLTDSEASLDRKYLLDFVVYVRTLKFVKGTPEHAPLSAQVPDSDSD
ncbi:hypothetical protein MSAN_01585800 [Mycena sanguinolenta]|uniref:Uncharacterized protein n=1 Tax=Mycena sanguinolenta TaxID=230812 RepID=A0A8H7CV23_9AGAR|nr:hypothetical protein MSAN_01585800 [Mycena sanguinolenta]